MKGPEFTYTTAPIDYDGFGTVTVEAVAGHLAKGAAVRLVKTPPDHVEWQRQRYWSGAIYLVALPDKWEELVELGLATNNSDLEAVTENATEHPDR